MTVTLEYVVYAAGLTLLSVILGSVFRNRLWTVSGLGVGLGNRDNVPTPTPISGRADRAAMNTLENFVVFAALALTAHVAGVDGERVAQGATLFFWARVVFLTSYLLGIKYVRTAAWVGGIVGDSMIVAAMLGAA